MALLASAMLLPAAAAQAATTAATGPDSVVGVALTADQNPAPLGDPAEFTVTVTTGTEPAPAGQVSIWDATAQHYLAFGCPARSPGTYACSGTFDTPGAHQLTATYNVWWPQALYGVSPPYTHAVVGVTP